MRNRSCQCAMWLMLLFSLAGCRSGGIPLLNFLPLSKPINVVIATDSPIESAYTLVQHEAFRKAFSKEVGREVYLDLALPLLLEPGLSTGWQQLAFVSPLQYEALSNSAKFEVLAVGASGVASGMQPGVIVVRADAQVQAISGLKGKSFAFGPIESARLYPAAVTALSEHGVRASDLKKQLLPVPGSLMHLADSAAILRAVMDGTADAGVVDASYLEALPTTATADEVSRGDVRELGRTLSVPDRLVIQSPKLDSPTAVRTREFLLGASHKYPAALKDVRIAGYAAPTEECLSNIRKVARGMTEPVGSRPAE